MSDRAATRTVKRAKRVLSDPKGSLNSLRRRLGSADASGSPAADAAPTLPAGLDPREALRANGYCVFRGLIPPAECKWIADLLKRDMKVEPGRKSQFPDITNRSETARAVLFDERMLSAVRSAVDPEVRFLQVAALQYDSDTASWHRDSLYRDVDNSTAPDWSDTTTPYGVVKAIVYLESENAGMGMMAGSHLSPIKIDADRVLQREQAHEQIVVGPDDEPNRRFTDAERERPVAWSAQVGDALVFDERMYHCGRRIEGGRVKRGQKGEKCTLSYVFGRDNAHSARMYSYFRYARRELPYKDLPDELQGRLAEHDLVLTQGWGNHFEQHPEELRGAYLRDGTDLDELIGQFAASGANDSAAARR